MGIVDAVEGEVLPVEFDYFDRVSDGCADYGCYGGGSQYLFIFPDGLYSHDYNYRRPYNIDLIPSFTDIFYQKITI